MSSCCCLLNILYSCMGQQQNCSQDSDTSHPPLFLSPLLSSSLDCFFSRLLPSLFSPCPRLSLCFPFSLFTSFCLAASLCIHFSLSLFFAAALGRSHIHTQRKQLNSVGPLLLHYVNHHFPSTTASFLSRLHFLHRMQIPAKLSPPVYLYPLLCVGLCV